MLDTINPKDIRILLISQNERLIREIQESYLFSGMVVDVASTVEYSFRMLIEQFYDAVILEISHANNRNEIVFSRELKEKFMKDTPIVAVGNGGAGSIDLYYNALYDCYIDDVADLELVRAYIISLIRRYRMMYGRSAEYDGLYIDMPYRIVRYEGKDVKIPLCGMRFVYHLICKSPDILLNSEIVHYIHGNKETGDKVLRTQLCKFKAALARAGWDGIETVSHVGYRLKGRGMPGEGRQRRLDRSRVLCLADSREISQTLEEFLAGTGMEYVMAASVEDFIARAAQGKFDILILDIIVGSMDAITLTRMLREKHDCNAYVVVLLNDKLVGCKVLYNGADDFIQKPVSRVAFEAKIGFIDKKSRGLLVDDDFEWEGLRVNPRQYVARYGDVEFSLPPIPFYLLLLLVRNAPGIVSFDDIRDIIFGKAGASKSLIFTHVTKIRKELKRAGLDCLKTVPRVGLTLNKEL